MAILEIEEEKLSNAINQLLTYLSKKYNVSKPYWIYSDRISYKALYFPNLKLIVFNTVKPEIIVHEFFHHVFNENGIDADEKTVNEYTLKEIENLEKENAIPDLWLQSYPEGITPASPIVFTVLGIFYDLLSLNPNISVEEKDTFSFIGVSLSIFGLVGALMI
jgi:hypothetical protein